MSERLDEMLARAVVQHGEERTREMLETLLLPLATEEEREAALAVVVGDNIRVPGDAYRDEIDEGYWVEARVWVGWGICLTCDRVHKPGTPCIKFENHYRCDACNINWVDEWSCACNDKCACGAEIQPYMTKEIVL